LVIIARDVITMMFVLMEGIFRSYHEECLQSHDFLK
jgi:hypothetical protein